MGNRRYVDFVQLEAFRWVNNNDIVVRVPPWWLGYRHKGQEVYLNSHGEIRTISGWRRMVDRWRGFLKGLRLREFDHLTDHSITRYVEYIERAVKEEEAVAVGLLPFSRPQIPARSSRCVGRRSRRNVGARAFDALPCGGAA